LVIENNLGLAHLALKTHGFSASINGLSQLGFVFLSTVVLRARWQAYLLLAVFRAKVFDVQLLKVRTRFTDEGQMLRINWKNIDEQK
jgi:hypothetical protein